MLGNEFAELVKPKVKNVSDKYSWNLYKFIVTKIKNQKLAVYYWPMHSKEHNPNMPNISDYYIGFKFDDALIGARILTIVDGGRNSFQLWSCGINTFYQGGDKLIKGLDVTDWFIDTYITKGRCLIDGDHSNWLQFPETRYSKILNPITNEAYDDRKYCNWCGKMLFKFEKEIVTVKTYETWVGI